nr:RNA polymerase sigma factor [Paracoccus shanxieyensis]
MKAGSPFLTVGLAIPSLLVHLNSTDLCTTILTLQRRTADLGRLQSVSHLASLRRHPMFTRLAGWGIKLQHMGMDRLYRGHRGDVRLYLARILRDADLAEDLTQDAFLRCFATVQAGGNPENLRSYLYRVARNVAVDHLRLQKRRRTDTTGSQTIAAIADPRPGPERVLIDRERLRIFAQALAALPNKTRRIFILHRIDGLTYRDVADRMDLSESSVQKHLARALFEVLQRLQDDEDG